MCMLYISPLRITTHGGLAVYRCVKIISKMSLNLFVVYWQMFAALILGVIVGSIYFQLCSSCDSGIQNRSAQQPPVYCYQLYFSILAVFLLFKQINVFFFFISKACQTIRDYGTVIWCRVWTNEWMILFPCDQKLAESRFSPTHTSTKGR